MATSVEGILERSQVAANDVQTLANAIAQKIQEGGDFVVRVGNTATGAVYGAGAGAKAGAATPTTLPPVVKYAGLAALAFLVFRRR
jgi:hypothetical protein